MMLEADNAKNKRKREVKNVSPRDSFVSLSEGHKGKGHGVVKDREVV